MAQTVKNLFVIQGTQVQSLGQEDTLEEGMPTCSTILTWRILWIKMPGRLQSMESQRVKTEELIFSLQCSPTQPREGIDYQKT